MALTNNNGDLLDNYYGTNIVNGVVTGPHPAPVSPCDQSTTFNKWGNPYDLQETIYWIIKMIILPILASILVIFIIILPTFENPIFVAINAVLAPIASIYILIVARESARAIWNRIPNDLRVTSGTPLNDISAVQFRIGFVGDIMMMNGHILMFDPAVVNFFNDVNNVHLIIGNLEGIVTNDKAKGSQQRHLPVILDELVSVLPPNLKWTLCLSNNHSIDYGNKAFHTSLIDIQKNPQFNVFGRNDMNNVLVQTYPISIATGTEWSNQDTWDCTSRYRNTELWTYYSNTRLNNFNRFNILFPHWGYENERYVRKRIQKDAKALLNGGTQTYTRYQTYIRERLDKEILPDQNGRKWDLIFGHHSHTPQPIMSVCDHVNDIGFNKLVAFSGGNFTSGAWIIRRKKHIYGTIMKCDIGPLTNCPTKLAVGNVEWRTTVNVRSTCGDKKYKTVSIYSRRYRTFAHYLWQFLLAVGIIALILLLRYLDSIL
ncbi:MAG: hypothetical protein EAX91_12385 [Candidatus Lokiarchaeota archaeon]|nr:hypothetical protein [Candidatus Lokiarchaeota archaeon]